MTFLPLVVRILLLIPALGLVAFLAPLPPFPTDKDIYESVSREGMIPGCFDLQCFRVVVPWTLGQLPGDGYPKWRAFAVICQALAALLMGRWVSRLGANDRSALQVTWLTAFGTGSLYTLFDPFTADPLMHLMGPALMLLIVDGRTRAATALAAVAVLGKEFAAVPLMVGALWRAQERRLEEARSLAIAAALVIGVWGAFNLYARIVWDYTTVHSHSTKLLSGGFIVFWLDHIGLSLAVASIAGVFGGLWLLWPAGLHLEPALRRLAWAAMGPLLFFSYVQQPDRALWNFAFVVMPAAAIVLDRVSAGLGWTLVAIQALVGLRIGAQLTVVPSVRLTLVAALVTAIVVVWHSYSSPQRAAILS